MSYTDNQIHQKIQEAGRFILDADRPVIDRIAGAKACLKAAYIMLNTILIPDSDIKEDNSVTMQIEGIEETPKGAVAYLKMPIVLTSMATMNAFVSQAYGPKAVATENPKGWLCIVVEE